MGANTECAGVYAREPIRYQPNSHPEQKVKGGGRVRERKFMILRQLF